MNIYYILQLMRHRQILLIIRWTKYFSLFADRCFFLTTDLKPVLVVGAGLSAADAVTICRSSGVNVIHVYRNRSVGLDKMLPENVYPEYHEVCLTV